MSNDPLGYARLAARHELAIRPLSLRATLDSRIRVRKAHTIGGEEVLSFPPTYRPEDTLVAHLQFALRYEGVNLEVLALLFEKTGPAELTEWLRSQPRSAYARRAGFLYEWLTGRKLDIKVPSKVAMTPVLDDDMQIARPLGVRNGRYRVINNLPGTPQFCPLIRRTAYIDSMLVKNLRERTQERLARYDPQLLARAAAFLYLKETHTSFDIERVRPSPARAQRFADLLRMADRDIDLSESKLVDLQNAVVDERFLEASFRHAQNWVGRDLGYRKRVVFVPPRPDDVPSLMEGLAAMAKQAADGNARVDAIALAASVAFGFVFIHPFIDGNGRLHRYLIHQVLSVAGFTPKGIILPVSAVILANLDRYNEALEQFSQPLLDRTRYNPETPLVAAEGNDVLYFRFFDATEQAAFLFWALDRTVEHDLESEVNYLLGYDAAFRQLNARLDWPGHSLDTFINVVAQNEGRLSNGKRKSYFSHLTDAEVAEFEETIRQAFSTQDSVPRKVGSE